MRQSLSIPCILIALVAFGGAVDAVEPPDRSREMAAKIFQHPDLSTDDQFRSVDQMLEKAGLETQRRLVLLGVDEATARLDARSGRFVTLLPSTPLIPGRGLNNDLRWEDLGSPPPDKAADLAPAAWVALVDYLEDHRRVLRVAPEELPSQPTLTSYEKGDLIQITAPREINGVRVRGSYLSATIKQGNLILLGAHKWGDQGSVSSVPRISAARASSLARKFFHPLRLDTEWGERELTFLPMLEGRTGYRYRLAWSIKARIEGDAGSWETLVDAHTGEILANQDQNHYAEVRGGVYPVSNDGIVPDGVEQAGWPMPFLTVGGETADTGGNVTATGSLTASLTGPFVRMNDNCGASSLTQTGGLDWGTSGGDDCVTPGFGGPGNTHSSRTGFYELNKLIEMARGQLPSNTWLQQQLTSNMNINQSCNAFWNGSTINFYRSGGGCSNTGELAGVFDHEWGHGMDANDAVPGIAQPSGEGIADIYTALRLNDSCIGRNFRSTVCSGFGDPCLSCTGVRDIDYEKRQSGQPHTFSWSNANCSGIVHCVGSVYAEAVWSLWKRDLAAAPYNMDDNTAHEVVNRLTFIGAGNTGTWFSGSPPQGGCAANSGYMNYLAADDDDGDLSNGTPHMTAIFQAFDRQEIACSTPTVQNSGCVGTPTTAPDVTATPGDRSATLSWQPVAGASGYQVFRTEGVFACAFGKVKIGETTGTTFSDSGLQNGREYSYVVLPIGASNTCMGPASACDTVTPAEGPQCVVNADCDNGLFCDGTEQCNAGVCEAGTPIQCDDGVGCTTDTCNEITDSCGSTPNDAACDNGLFCDGSETCDLLLGCQLGSDPCGGGACNETGDFCVECSIDADCDNGLFCDGAETCQGGLCQAGAPPCGTGQCDESTDICLNTAPTVSITSPQDGTLGEEGDPITLTGTANDAEDGNISGNLVWTSNLDGSLGTGASITAELSLGTHTITASATDSGGLSDTAQITVVIED